VPWCPKCGYEYRPEITQCPNCQVALVAEPPPAPPPTIAGWRVEEKTARSLRCFSALRESMQLARYAAAITLRSRNLLLIIALLTTIWFAGTMFQSHLFTRAFVKDGGYLPPYEADDLSLQERWEVGVMTRAPMDYLFQEFGSPLYKPTSIASPLVQGITVLILTSRGDFSATNMLKFPLPNMLMITWETLIIVAAGSLIQALLLGWLFSLAGGMPRKPWRHYLKSHYLPLFALALCISFGFLLLMFGPNLVSYYRSLATEPGPIFKIGKISDFIFYNLLSRWILPPVFLLLALAPFAIVGRNLGAWGGVKAGVRIFWEKKWSLFGLFLIYRVIYEVIQVISLAFPSERFMALNPKATVQFANWLIHLALASLGLWLAIAFTLLVVSPKESAPKPCE